MIDCLIGLINGSYPLTSIDIGTNGIFSAAGMKFDTTRYDAYGLGSVSVMHAKGALGLMKMESVIINPFHIDAPLLSCDSITAFGKRTVVLEMYDTTLTHSFNIAGIELLSETGKNIPEKAIKPHWYDALRMGTPHCKMVNRKNSDAFNVWVREYFRAYVEACAKAPACDETEKRKKAAEYSEGLLSNGGPATDPLKKALGEEKAAYLFRNILFATEKNGTA